MPAWVFLGLLACVLSLPARVEAGCGAHVVDRSGRDGLERLHDPLILGGEERSLVGLAQPADPHRQRPCAGPSCSGHSTPPAIPMPADARIAEAWACLGTGVPLPALDSELVTSQPGGIHPILISSVIFHPPR